MIDICRNIAHGKLSFLVMGSYALFMLLGVTVDLRFVFVGCGFALVYCIAGMIALYNMDI